MEQEHIDPIYEYIDEKIADIKGSLEQALLETQQSVAALRIDSLTHASCDIIDFTYKLSTK